MLGILTGKFNKGICRVKEQKGSAARDLAVLRRACLEAELRPLEREWPTCCSSSGSWEEALVLRVLTGVWYITRRQCCWNSMYPEERSPFSSTPGFLPVFLLLAEPNWKQRKNVLCRVLVPVAQGQVVKG